MDRGYYGQTGSNGSDWDNNFSSVINRTRQNIDRITTKYGAQSISSTDNDQLSR